MVFIGHQVGAGDVDAEAQGAVVIIYRAGEFLAIDGEGDDVTDLDVAADDTGHRDVLSGFLGIDDVIGGDVGIEGDAGTDVCVNAIAFGVGGGGAVAGVIGGGDGGINDTIGICCQIAARHINAEAQGAVVIIYRAGEFLAIDGEGDDVTDFDVGTYYTCDWDSLTCFGTVNDVISGDIGIQSDAGREIIIQDVSSNRCIGQIEVFKHRGAIWRNDATNTDTEGFSWFEYVIVNGCNGERRGNAICTNDGLYCFNNVVAICGDVGIGECNYAASWRWVTQGHSVGAGIITFCNCSWTIQSYSDSILRTRYSFIDDVGAGTVVGTYHGIATGDAGNGDGEVFRNFVQLIVNGIDINGNAGLAGRDHYAGHTDKVGTVFSNT
ncbi:hypothetical protein SHAM105786_16920 [Shewanella amazonensis]